MATKSFAKNIAGGNTLDKARRTPPTTDAIAARFDVASEALEGRTSLLDRANNPPTGEGASSFHVETLVQEGKATLRFARVALASIDDNPLNSRSFYSEDIVKERAASIATHGQMMPAVVAPNPKDATRYILVDGQYRKRANLHLGNTDMDVCIVEGLTPVDFYKLAKELNNEREQESVLDVAYGYRKLLDQGLARTEEELAQIAGDSKGRVNKLLSLTTLPQGVQDLITQHPDSFGVAAAYELTLYAKATDEERTIALAERIVREELPVLKVQGIRQKAQEGTKATRKTSRQYKLVHNGAELGTFKEWDTGRISLDVTLVDPAKREKLLASLKRELKRELELDE